jgi:polyether ionophore transport system permease protein
MTPFTGTRALTRLALRLDRVRLTVWVLVIALSPAATAAQYNKLYPTEESLQQVKGVIDNPSLVALNGPLFGVSIGGLTAWKIGITEFILIALMNLLTIVRHTRTEEETGRSELIAAGVVGRYALVTAALVTTTLANIAIVLVTTLGLPVGGAFALALSIGVTGVLFAAVAAVAAQLTESARAAIGISAAVLGVAYLLRALGDTGPTWVSWLSPIGWAMRIEPFAANRWWVLALIVALLAVFIGAAYGLAGRRDLGAGLLPQRPGPAQAAPGLRSTFALAWRLHRGILTGWVVAMLLSGAVLGGAAAGIGKAHLTNQKMIDLLDRLGGHKGLVDAYLAAVFGIVGLVAAAYTVQATLRPRGEETSGRVEPLLATPTGRIRWAASHLVFAFLGTALLLVAAGLGGGLAYGSQVHDVGGQVPRLLGAALVQLPAAWVFAGFGAALFGLLPRLSSLAWAALVVCLLVFDLGILLKLNQWVVDVSPFAHVPKLPGGAVTATPLVWLSVVAAALTAAGMAGFRRRDIG